MNYLPKPELAKMFRAMHEYANPLHHQLALVLFFTGTRVSQALSLRGCDIFEFNGRMHIRLRAAKNGEGCVHPLHVDADPALDMTPLLELARTKGICRLFGGLDRFYFNRCLKKYADLAGLPEEYAHSHVFRHSAAMVIMSTTQRVGAVQKFLGHKSAASSMIYLAENDQQYAVDAMDAFNLTLEVSA